MASAGFCMPVPDGSVPGDALSDEGERDLARAEIDAVVHAMFMDCRDSKSRRVLESFQL